MDILSVDIGPFLSQLARDAVWVIGGAAVPVMGRWWRNNIERGQLRRAFGSQVESADDVTFILPLWKALDCDRSLFRFENQKANGEFVEYYGPDRNYAASDATAAFMAAQAFGHFFTKPIIIKPDTETLKSTQTNLMIGTAVANRHVEMTIALYEAERPEELPLSLRSVEETEENQAAEEIVNRATGETYRFDGVTDYAFIMRLPKIEDGDGYHFILGGIDESGTEAAGQMMRRHWKRFAKYKGPAALILSLQRGQTQTRRPAAWIHRKGNKWVTTPGRDIRGD